MRPCRPTYEQILLGSDIELRPLDQATLFEAAKLRAAAPAIRTPDALHAATAKLCGASLFVTNDDGFRRVPGLPLAVLHDLLGP